MGFKATTLRLLVSHSTNCVRQAICYNNSKTKQNLEVVQETFSVDKTISHPSKMFSTNKLKNKLKKSEICVASENKSGPKYLKK